jgi:hypothetical protein
MIPFRAENEKKLKQMAENPKVIFSNFCLSFIKKWTVISTEMIPLREEIREMVENSVLMEIISFFFPDFRL